MILHDGLGPPQLDDFWDTYDQDYIWVAWDEVLRGATISDSAWVIPASWTNHAEQQSASVTDEDGNAYEAANGVLLSTTAVSGRHRISNRIMLSDDRQYERTIIVVVRQL